MREHLQSVVEAFQALSAAAGQPSPGRSRQSGGNRSR
jgi:hypothetical protein